MVRVGWEGQKYCRDVTMQQTHNNTMLEVHLGKFVDVVVALDVAVVVVAAVVVVVGGVVVAVVVVCVVAALADVFVVGDLLAFDVASSAAEFVKLASTNLSVIVPVTSASVAAVVLNGNPSKVFSV